MPISINNNRNAVWALRLMRLYNRNGLSYTVENFGRREEHQLANEDGSTGKVAEHSDE
jgi:hypothetical protein